MAVFLSGALILTHLWFSLPHTTERGVLGGPLAQAATEIEPAVTDTLLAATTKQAVVPTTNDMPSGVDRASVRSTGEPIGIFSGQGSIITYVVKKGDTLSQIAREFGVSVQTITGVNPTLRANTIQVGQELSILPVSGVLYYVQGGEDVDYIANLFGVSADRIREYNKEAISYNNPLSAGTSILIPGGTAIGSVGRAPKLPKLSGYFTMPTNGFNWGRLHNYNAVDIANVCGTPVMAAAEGLVVEVVADGWNNGYGHMVLIEHPNETKTRYAHMQDISVEVGDYIKQNAQVGTMGNTGNIHGPTGCHLHFEVEGAANPFAK